MMRPNVGTWALIPVKRFGDAKQRLSGLLTNDERAYLARVMLEDVLRTLSQIEEFAGVLVVTDDDSVQKVAQDAGADVIIDKSGAGLNGAIEAGQRALGRRSKAIVVLPGDIPQLSADDLRTVLGDLDEALVVAAPAKRDGGTNLLAAAPAGALAPAFGPDSFARHVESARRRGIEARIRRLASVALDLDRADDIAEFMAQPGTTRTHRYLADIGVVTRLRQLHQRKSVAQEDRCLSADHVEPSSY
jgi:2-phospho-L-lactate/phosphoenolpyruvate guanylyltransferase